MKWRDTSEDKYMWHRWYAWHPVKVEGQWVWREYVWRQYLDNPYSLSSYWIYSFDPTKLLP